MTKTMNDFFGQPLALGDEVAFIPNGYRDLHMAKIIAFTAKQVRVAFMNTWNFQPPGYAGETLRYPDTLIKKPNENDLMELELLRGEVDRAKSQAIQNSWQGEVDRQGGSFTAEEIANATQWR